MPLCGLVSLVLNLLAHIFLPQNMYFGISLALVFLPLSMVPLSLLPQNLYVALCITLVVLMRIGPLTLEIAGVFLVTVFSFKVLSFLGLQSNNTPLPSLPLKPNITPLRMPLKKLFGCEFFFLLFVYLFHFLFLYFVTTKQQFPFLLLLPFPVVPNTSIFVFILFMHMFLTGLSLLLGYPLPICLPIFSPSPCLHPLSLVTVTCSALFLFLLLDSFLASSCGGVLDYIHSRMRCVIP